MNDDRTRIATRGSAVSIGAELNQTYRIDSLLGVGGMGEVFKGHNIQTGDPVAIKIVLPEYAQDETILGLFRKEARILNHLYHEAIVRYYVFSFDPTLKRPYLAMEYVDGPSLAAHVKSAPLPASEFMPLLRRLADGLHRAHLAGVIHRDMSPDNVILPGGLVQNAKIIDFGIARSANVGGETLLGGSFAGKYNFVSPEQLGLYGAEVTPRSDIYSLALVMAAAMRGGPLDMSGSQLDIIEKRRSVPDLASVPRPFHAVLSAMLEPDPARRPADMAAIRDWPDPQPAPKPKPEKPKTAPVAAAGSRPAAPSHALRNTAFAGAVVAVIGMGALGGWIYTQTDLVAGGRQGETTSTADPTGDKPPVTARQGEEKTPTTVALGDKTAPAVDLGRSGGDSRTSDPAGLTSPTASDRTPASTKPKDDVAPVSPVAGTPATTGAKSTPPPGSGTPGPLEPAGKPNGSSASDTSGVSATTPPAGGGSPPVKTGPANGTVGVTTSGPAVSTPAGGSQPAATTPPKVAATAERPPAGDGGKSTGQPVKTAPSTSLPSTSPPAIDKPPPTKTPDSTSGKPGSGALGQQASLTTSVPPPDLSPSIASLQAFVADFSADHCFAATRNDLSAALGRTGRKSATFTALATPQANQTFTDAFQQKAGFAPTVALDPVADDQCAFVRALPRLSIPGVQALSLTLSKSDILGGDADAGTAGDPLTVSVGGVGDRNVYLFVMDHKGGIQNINRLCASCIRMKPGAMEAGLSLFVPAKVEGETPPPFYPMLVFAVASSKPLISVNTQDAFEAEDFITPFLQEIADRTDVTTAVGFVKLRDK